jgi:hypothetical protein
MTLQANQIIAFDKAFNAALLKEENWNANAPRWEFVDADVTIDLVEEFDFDLNLTLIYDEFESSASEINTYLSDMNINSFAQYKEQE